ncbi:GDSL-type esterase/lipase family protein [Akkermansia sp. N21169]|uniref:GDSL-type esterase/lipase family protein n=1 Tax=Akkermansia sp. N21169 TaxID=3040765 RepID=UPI00244EF0E4|nr:GDSL-type esterase/lipase family protein [Akkermansia sp. N21169]MDH3068465.1 GDSL-type esterase/lipase family protein [Akkermansia sp. N21169]
MMKHFLLLAMLVLAPCLTHLTEAVPSTLKPESQDRDKTSYTWTDRHEAIKLRHQSVKPEYVIIGDSITHHWGGEPADWFGQYGQASWARLFGPHTVTNMGFGFDYVDNAYYRVEQGELDGISPRVVILMIGTNNLGHRKDSAQACADNTKALVSLIRQKTPASKILILGILPRREKELGPVIADTNKHLASLADNKTIFFANPGLALQSNEPGIIRNTCTSDGVHLKPTGYGILGEEIAGTLSRIDSSYKGGKVPRPETIDGIAPEQIQLAAIGDSITDNYHKAQPPYQDFLPIWKEFYTPYNAVNLGVSGNTTDDVLARIGNQGILDHISPKVVQIMIGTNDTGQGISEEETFRGIRRVVDKVRAKLPESHILLIGILPSNIHHWHVPAAAEPVKKFQTDMKVNDRLARFYSDRSDVTFLDIRHVFLNPDGSLRSELFYDPHVVVINGQKAGPLHPDTKGQRLMAETIHPFIERLLKNRDDSQPD